MRTYKVSPFYRISSAKMLRDLPRELGPSVQNQYLDLVVGLFMRSLVRVYSPDALTEADVAKLKKYLDRIIEAKGALSQSES